MIIVKNIKNKSLHFKSNFRTASCINEIPWLSCLFNSISGLEIKNSTISYLSDLIDSSDGNSR